MYLDLTESKSWFKPPLETIGANRTMDIYNVTRTCQLDADNNLGPAVSHYVRSFDFTLLFEQTILSIPSSTIFLLLSP